MNQPAKTSSIKRLARSMRKSPTDAERKFWQMVKDEQLGYKFRRQFQIDDKYIVDFICLPQRLVVEIDGGQHNESIADADRTKYLAKQGFRIIRFWNNEILGNLDACLEVVMRELNSTPPPRPSPVKGEGEKHTAPHEDKHPARETRTAPREETHPEGETHTVPCEEKHPAEETHTVPHEETHIALRREKHPPPCGGGLGWGEVRDCMYKSPTEDERLNMQFLRFTLHPQTAFGMPIVGDTLFGQLSARETHTALYEKKHITLCEDKHPARETHTAPREEKHPAKKTHTVPHEETHIALRREKHPLLCGGGLGWGKVRELHV